MLCVALKMLPHSLESTGMRQYFHMEKFCHWWGLASFITFFFLWKTRVKESWLV